MRPPHQPVSMFHLLTWLPPTGFKRDTLQALHPLAGPLLEAIHSEERHRLLGDPERLQAVHREWPLHTPSRSAGKPPPSSLSFEIQLFRGGLCASDRFQLSPQRRRLRSHLRELVGEPQDARAREGAFALVDDAELVGEDL
eukprot:1673709-Prymnesium_polylepis.1